MQNASTYLDQRLYLYHIQQQNHDGSPELIHQPLQRKLYNKKNVTS